MNSTARMHGPVIWMALDNEGDWWMDTYNHGPAGRMIICIYTPILVLCNAIKMTGQMPSRFYIILSDVILSANISL